MRERGTTIHRPSLARLKLRAQPGIAERKGRKLAAKSRRIRKKAGERFCHKRHKNHKTDKRREEVQEEIKIVLMLVFLCSFLCRL